MGTADRNILSPAVPNTGARRQTGDTCMSSAELIREAVSATTYLANVISADNGSNETPCEQFNLHELVTHMSGVFAVSAAAATKSGPIDRPSPQAISGDGPGSALAEWSSKMADAWATPDAFEGRTHLGDREMSAFIAGHITLFEILVHGWDLAMATGQQLELSMELAAASLVTAQRLCTEPARDAGAFGVEVTAPSQSGPFERALALAGRDPNWSA